MFLNCVHKLVLIQFSDFSTDFLCKSVGNGSDIFDVVERLLLISEGELFSICVRFHGSG